MTCTIRSLGLLSILALLGADARAQTIELTPGRAVDVELPMFPSGVIPLLIDVTSGFSPKDADPKSTDRRFLGIWVELKAPGVPADKP